MQDPSADVTFLPVKTSHTLMYVTHPSYRKCVFPFTILPLLPIKSTEENVIQPAARLNLSLHVESVRTTVTQKRKRVYSSILNIILGLR